MDWKWHAIYTRITGKQGFASKRTTKKLLKWLKNQKPDVIHLHNLHGNFINIGLLFEFLAKENIATVITLHDCWYFTGKCFHFVESACERWKSQCKNCPRKSLDIPNYFGDNSFYVFNKKKELINNLANISIVGCSDWMCNLARESFLKEKEIIRIYNGIDTQVFKPMKSDFRKLHNIGEKFLILGMANKWNLSKNRDVVEAVCDYFSDDIIVIAGCHKNDKTYFEPFKNVVCIEYSDNANEMAKVYSAADVFVNLTLADTLPTVNMESLSCGTPVITYKTGGSTELVNDGVTGYVVEQLDKDSLIKSILNIKNGLIQRSVCREIACSEFDKNLNYNQYIELYKRISQIHKGDMA